MTKQRSKTYTIVLAVFTAIQSILIFLNFAFAFWGTYAANKPSNIWSQIWDKSAIGLWSVLLCLVTVILGIIGLVLHKKGPKAQIVLSLVLIVLFPLTWFSMIMAIGSHF